MTLLGVLPILCYAVDSEEFMGKDVRQLPDGCVRLNGHVDWKSRKVLQWVRCGGQNFALIAEFNQVQAVHTFPPIPKGFKISFEDHCSDSIKANDSLLFAVVRWKDRKDGQFASDIRHAWRSDVDKNRFVQLNPNNVKCRFYWP